MTTQFECTRLTKGYAADAGYDVILNEDITLKPGLNIINLKLSVQVSEGEFAYLCSRTSSAKEGILVHQCPIDANYTGNIHAIVQNMSGMYKIYNKGMAFCQLVYCKMGHCNDNYEIKKQGKRTDGAFGSTDKKEK